MPSRPLVADETLVASKIPASFLQGGAATAMTAEIGIREDPRHSSQYRTPSKPVLRVEFGEASVQPQSSSHAGKLHVLLLYGHLQLRWICPPRPCQTLALGDHDARCPSSESQFEKQLLSK